MPEPTTVHWLGTGLSSGSGLRVVAENADRTVLWARTKDKANALLDRLGLAGDVEPRELSGGVLDPEPRAGDVVVSMLPAAEHPALLRRCVDRGAHFACSSYVTEELRDQAVAAERAGLVVLTESGLDPGLDHVFAHDLVARARDAVGDGPATVTFTSHCGGVPAVPNAFRYRFSWSPLGVLNALRQPARYLQDGAELIADEPWEHTREHVLGPETFEVYPNRDSLPFIEQYGIPAAWTTRTFIRGTLRLRGWLEAWHEVFAEVRTGKPERLARLADTLADRYPMTESDHDRVVLAVSLHVSGEDGRTYAGTHELDVVGNEIESAMARCVSLPLAHGILETLTGQKLPGLRHIAENGPEARRCLTFLNAHGLEPRTNTTFDQPDPEP